MKLSTYALLLLMVPFMGCSSQSEIHELELIGHRGATGLLPENTIPGFKKAVELGVNSVEFDVVISGDEQVVISHDPWFRHDICLTPEGEPIDEESQKDHLIYKMTYEEIAQYDCGSIQRPGYPDQQTRPLLKPLMKEAITEVEAFREENGHAPVDYNVEIKSKRAWWKSELQPEPKEVAQLVYNELQELDMLGRSKIFAFNSRVLNAFHEIDSTVTQVYLISKRKPDVEANLDKLTHLPDVYAPNYALVDSALVEEVHAKGMHLIPWTVNDYKEMIRLVNLGVDGLISDYPGFYERVRNHHRSLDQAAL